MQLYKTINILEKLPEDVFALKNNFFHFQLSTLFSTDFNNFHF